MYTKLTPQQVHTLKRIRHVVEETKATEWTTGEEHSKDGKKHCFIGHMQNNHLEAQWKEIEQRFNESRGNGYLTISVEEVNDAGRGHREYKLYPRKTPRGRCIALLKHVFKVFGLKG